MNTGVRHICPAYHTNLTKQCTSQDILYVPNPNLLYVKDWPSSSTNLRLYVNSVEPNSISTLFASKFSLPAKKVGTCNKFVVHVAFVSKIKNNISKFLPLM